jgi:hypothetical protein
MNWEAYDREHLNCLDITKNKHPWLLDNFVSHSEEFNALSDDLSVAETIALVSQITVSIFCILGMAVNVYGFVLCSH